jgi:ubiquinone/menaquinone biosynthesis C-methylase UbiE
MNKTIPHTCPWWLLPTFDNPLRRLINNPQQILSGYVHPGDMVLDVGCGMGYFTLPLAELVGDEGCVIAADIQQQMLDGLRFRAEDAGMLNRVRMLRSTPNQIGLDCQLDFALAFWMVHEVRQPEPFLQEIYSALKSGGTFLIVEPIIHVPKQAFEETVRLADRLGFVLQEKPQVKFSRAVLLYK